MWVACYLACVVGCHRDDHEVSAISLRIERRLGLKLPCEIHSAQEYDDGGSIGGTILDATGQQLQFWWDGGMRLRPEDVSHLGDRFGTTDPVTSGPRLVYLGAHHREDRQARALLVGSAEESAFVDVLRLAVSKHFPLATQDSIAAIWMDHRPLSGRTALADHLSRSETHELEAIRLAVLLRMQRSGTTIDPMSCPSATVPQ